MSIFLYIDSHIHSSLVTIYHVHGAICTYILPCKLGQRSSNVFFKYIYIYIVPEEPLTNFLSPQVPRGKFTKFTSTQLYIYIFYFFKKSPCCFFELYICIYIFLIYIYTVLFPLS